MRGSKAGTSTPEVGMDGLDRISAKSKYVAIPSLKQWSIPKEDFMKCRNTMQRRLETSHLFYLKEPFAKCNIFVFGLLLQISGWHGHFVGPATSMWHFTCSLDLPGNSPKTATLRGINPENNRWKIFWGSLSKTCRDMLASRSSGIQLVKIRIDKVVESFAQRKTPRVSCYQWAKLFWASLH